MKRAAITIALALAVSTFSALAQNTTNLPPAGNGPGRGPGGFHILPPRASEQLNLTADQQKQLADLEADIKTKIETILTPAQMDQLKKMRPPHRQGGPGAGEPAASGESHNRPQPPSDPRPTE